MESLDAEFSGPPNCPKCHEKHFFLSDGRCYTVSEIQHDGSRKLISLETPDKEEPKQELSLADQKAAEAAAAVKPLNRMERICGYAANRNLQSIKDCFEGVLEIIEMIFDPDGIPHGDPTEIMQEVDNGKNLLALAQNCYDAAMRPVMQSASIAVEMLAATPHEPAAEDRDIWTTGTRVYHILFGPQASGTVMEYDWTDGTYLIKWDAGSEPGWSRAAELRKV